MKPSLAIFLVSARALLACPGEQFPSQQIQFSSSTSRDSVNRLTTSSDDLLTSSLSCLLFFTLFSQFQCCVYNFFYETQYRCRLTYMYSHILVQHARNLTSISTSKRLSQQIPRPTKSLQTSRCQWMHPLPLKENISIPKINIEKYEHIC